MNIDYDRLKDLLASLSDDFYSQKVLSLIKGRTKTVDIYPNFSDDFYNGKYEKIVKENEYKEFLLSFLPQNTFPDDYFKDDNKDNIEKDISKIDDIASTLWVMLDNNNNDKIEISFPIITLHYFASEEHVAEIRTKYRKNIITVPKTIINNGIHNLGIHNLIYIGNHIYVSPTFRSDKINKVSLSQFYILCMKTVSIFRIILNDLLEIYCKDEAAYHNNKILRYKRKLINLFTNTYFIKLDSILNVLDCEQDTASKNILITDLNPYINPINVISFFRHLVYLKDDILFIERLFNASILRKPILSKNIISDNEKFIHDSNKINTPIS